jgi:hypothetical protein
MSVSTKAVRGSLPKQRDNQEEQGNNEFDGIELLWAESDRVTTMATTQPPKQLEKNH